MAGWVFRARAVAGFQAPSDRGLVSPRMAFCPAGVRNRESGSDIAVNVKEFVY